MRRELAICLLLAAITLEVYWPVRHYDFVAYDDPAFVTESAQVQSGVNWQSLRWALTARIADNWHPVTTVCHMEKNQQLLELYRAGHPYHERPPQ